MPPPLNRREFVTSALATAAITATTPNFSYAAPQKPNILFILADDLGYGDLSCYGRPDYQTPNLDRLAAQGVRFTNAYSASPLCTPTRCAFITGRYPARTHIGLEEPLFERSALAGKALTLGLPPAHPTIASLLKKSGYDTALIGKWHLGYLPKFGPIQSGFDEFFGVMSGAVDFFTHKDMEGAPDLFEGRVPVERIGYLTEMLTVRAVEYIKKRSVRRIGQVKPAPSVRPFYLSLHYTAPHWPWEAPSDRAPSPELRGPVAFHAGGSLKTYAAMMKSLDDGIGEVLKALAQSGLERDTLVIFTSDNGGERFSYHWPFVGQKNSLWEGGIRVPAIVRWPGGAVVSNVQRPKSNEGVSNVADPNSNVREGFSAVGAPIGSNAGTESRLVGIATGSQLESNFQRPMSNVHEGFSAVGAPIGFIAGTEPEAVATGSQLESNVQRPMSQVATVAAGSDVSAQRSSDTSHPTSDTRSPGRIIHTPCITMDWTATILAAAQVQADPNFPLDGIDLLPILRKTDTRHPTPDTQLRTFFWRNANQDAAVRGPWKYLNDGTREYLFNLLIDQREQANFKDQNPALFNELRAAYKSWESTVLPRPPARTSKPA